ncbi:MAG: carboxypeptidase-like regulatory domain-containing protein [Flavobacteriales bacterium]
MRYVVHVLYLWCALFAATVTAQTTGALRGRVIDEVSGAGLPGASVEVLLADTVVGVATDATGGFHFAALPTGIHRVRVRYVGYAAAEREEVWVRAGKTEVLELGLPQAVQTIPTVEVGVGATALGRHRK